MSEAADKDPDREGEANRKLEKAEKKVAKKIEKEIAVPVSIEEELMLEAAELEELSRPKKRKSKNSDR